MSAIDSIIQESRNFVQAQGWSKLRFAKEIGVPESTLRDFDKDCWSPSVKTLRQIESYIKGRASHDTR